MEKRHPLSIVQNSMDAAIFYIVWTEKLSIMNI